MFIYLLRQLPEAMISPDFIILIAQVSLPSFAKKAKLLKSKNYRFFFKYFLPDPCAITDIVEAKITKDVLEKAVGELGKAELARVQCHFTLYRLRLFTSRASRTSKLRNLE